MPTLTERGVSDALLERFRLASGFGCACGFDDLRRLFAVLATGHPVTPRAAYRVGLSNLPRHIRALEAIGLVIERVHVPRQDGGGRKQRGYVLLGAQSAALTLWRAFAAESSRRFCSDACRHYVHLRHGGLQ